MREWLKSVFQRTKKLDERQAESLRLEFQARYHQFKLLLSANNKALEIMAQIDDALKGIGCRYTITTTIDSSNPYKL